MKKIAFLLLIGTFMMSQLEGHVELTYPEGGETFHPGDAVNVTWIEVVRHNFLGWHLLFSKDGGEAWDTIQAYMPVEILEYRWTVPSTPTEKGRIKIVQDNENDDYEGISSYFNITFTTGTIDPLHTIEMKMYPNPLIDYTTIAFENPEHINYTLAIYNTQGSMVRAIYPVTSGKVKVERRNLTDGLYFILLRDDEEIRAMGKLAVE
jgi:hypothetical protein